jgi:hypothetical protein
MTAVFREIQSRKYVLDDSFDLEARVASIEARIASIKPS